MDKPSNLTVIRNRIKKAQPGTVYVAVDFVNISDKTNINAYLSVLAEQGVLHRILRGVYYKPSYNELLKEYVSPDTNKVAQAIARNYGWTIVPSGDTALNMLGLSTQVPAVYVYASDGAYKEYEVNNTKIQFKRTTNRDLAKLTYKTALVVQALKALGKEHIDNAVIAQLQRALTAEEKSKMLTEAMARHHEDLEKSFTDEQKEIFEKFHDCWSEYASLSEAAIFEYAFRLGMRIAIDSIITK